jgi:hypothetical protein
MATASGTPATFTVTSVAAGTCHIAITDGVGSINTETIVVTTTGGAVS